ncbi:MAG: hypothetical protein Q7J73_08050, partial [Dehalococcoidales bacterium]|nr:hypothetical protein [Dehalococcoidales bacterium]
TLQRLKQVETLALVLKKGKVSDATLAEYINHQHSLTQAGINISTLTLIIKAAKIATEHDGGKQLLHEFVFCK